jgi:S1-C subfamily serine protease
MNRIFLGAILTAAILFSPAARAEFSEEVVARISRATVRVVVLENGEPVGHGTGFFISRQGHVATNRHVVETAEQIGVLYREGDQVFLRRASVVALGEEADLAILKIDPIRAAGVAVLATGDLAPGQRIMTVGFPGVLDEGKWRTLKEGVVETKPGREWKIVSAGDTDDFTPAVFTGAVAKCLTTSGMRLVLHSAKISPGNSGGPLIDEEGRVCGVNTALVPASVAGSDYPVSIHASCLASLAREHGIPVVVETGKVSLPGWGRGAVPALVALVAVLSVLCAVLLFRRPRAAIARSVSRVSRAVRKNPSAPAPVPAARPVAPEPRRVFLFRGRSPDGHSCQLRIDSRMLRASGGRVVVGRNPDICQLHLPHDSVSRQHATFVLLDGVLHVEDRNSGNGTRVNGREVPVGSAPVPVHPGDRLALGEVELVLDAEG